MYIVAKIVFALLFILAWVWSLIKQRMKGNVLQLIMVSTFFQITPLFVRLFVYIPSFQLGFSLIVIIISLIAFIGYLALLFVADSKQIKDKKKFEGSEIEVVSESKCELRNKK